MHSDVIVGKRFILFTNLGNVAVRVTAVTDTDVVTRVEVPGYVSNNKGINLPGVAVSVPALSEKDRDAGILREGNYREVSFALLRWIVLSAVGDPLSICG